MINIVSSFFIRERKYKFKLYYDEHPKHSKSESNPFLLFGT